ncbi:SDR family NAD(P)-dependent oxidoreductase [Nonomuraea antimicrobica]
MQRLPVRCWDVRQAGHAFRFMAQARHTGKIVLTIPHAPDPDGTTLITGGTGGLGATLARHLAATGQARHLLLASRRGDQAPGADQLRADLQAAGAQVEFAACDLSHPEQTQALLAGIPAEHPLTAIFHTAGVLDDALITNLDHDKIDRILKPKTDAAWHLHQATHHLDLAAFVLYSSSAGTLDSAGQGNYSAANAFLDALATHRRHHGLPAQSLAWGLWQQPSGMSAHLTHTDLTRIHQAGYQPITAEHGDRLLVAALTRPQPHLLPLPIDVRALARRSDDVPAILRALVPAATRRVVRSGPASEVSSLRQRLEGLPAAEWTGEITKMVRESAARVIGYSEADAVRAEQNFLEAGFDSLTAMELRNLLNQATGLRMPATAVFDYGTAAALAKYIAGEISTGGVPGPAAVASGTAEPDGGGSLSSLVRAAGDEGKLYEGLELLEAAARLRRSFGTLEEVGRDYPPLALASGPAQPKLFCFSTPMALGGASQFARLAQHFQGVRDLYALQVPGYAPDDSLPESVDVVVRMWAESILETAGGDPFVVVGYCGGGNFAHAAVTYMEAKGCVRRASCCWTPSCRTATSSASWAARCWRGCSTGRRRSVPSATPGCRPWDGTTGCSGRRRWWTSRLRSCSSGRTPRCPPAPAARGRGRATGGPPGI